jgi:hypothetical protein
VQVALEVSGSRLSAAEWQNWLSPWQGYEEVREQLGPALAGAIVAQHGGALTVQGEDKGEVVLSFTLPPLVKADESSEPAT